MMSKAYLIAHVQITNRERFMEEYASKVPATIEAAGGKYLVRSPAPFHDEGESAEDIHVVVEFPSRDAALGWLNSDAYQAMLPGRLENSTGRVLIFDGLPD
ncbi:uncharacterized protein METZ01_LOCUS224261 [marine metagenome]|uniref:DUF1330 domain-containing protein n=1 Tax=marine metagenome TaxID=408172 RepID=A0A382GA32_9ZZZZ|tara:strand:- start:118 stop:420 length:303 start_codon:yes stop_codon:yes gene_type:complete